MPDRDDALVYIALGIANGRDGNNASSEMERNEAAVYAAMGMDKENNPMSFESSLVSSLDDELCQ